MGDSTVVLETSLADLPLKRGKVRDIYDLGSRLLLVSTDRISAFDWVLPTGIPDKGRILTQISKFWFQTLDEKHHLLTDDLTRLDLPASPGQLNELRGRTLVVRKTRVVPIECVVRGYLSGSGWKEYKTRGSVCGIKLPPGLTESARLPEPIFTPATKAESGHDQNISWEQMAAIVGADVAQELRERSLSLYRAGAELAAQRGILIADTKFEWGFVDTEIILIDEVFTPDSSRFWPAESYAPGGPQPSFDKQFVRDWLESTGWDKQSAPPALPADVVENTRQRYLEAYRILTGRDLE